MLHATCIKMNSPQTITKKTQTIPTNERSLYRIILHGTTVVSQNKAIGINTIVAATPFEIEEERCRHS